MLTICLLFLFLQMWCTHTLTLLFYSYMPAKDHAIHSLALCCIEGCTTVLAPRQDVGCNGGARSCDRSSSRSDHLKIIMCMSLIQNPCIYSQPYLAIEHLKIIMRVSMIYPPTFTHSLISLLSLFSKTQISHETVLAYDLPLCPSERR